MGPTDKLKAKARTLFESGKSVPAIAQTVKRSESTVYRWMTADERRGDPWERRQQVNVSDLRDVIAVLIGRLREHAQDRSIPTPAWADALMKLLTSLDKTTDMFGDSLQKLIVVEELLRLAQDELDEDDFPVVVGFLNGYMAAVEEACR